MASETPNINLDVLNTDIAAQDGEMDFRLFLKLLIDYRESNMTKIDEAVEMVANMDIDGGTF